MSVGWHWLSVVKKAPINWVFQTACFSTIGHFVPLSFTAIGGKIQATRYAGGR